MFLFFIVVRLVVHVPDKGMWQLIVGLRRWQEMKKCAGRTSSLLLALVKKSVKINIIILKKERTVMEIKKTKNGNELIFAIQGRLDTTTAPQFEAELKQNMDGVETLILDLVDLEYLSSAGLRVLLTAQKIMNKQGEMIVRNANETISEIFEVTGFSDILTIE